MKTYGTKVNYNTAYPEDIYNDTAHNSPPHHCSATKDNGLQRYKLTPNHNGLQRCNAPELQWTMDKAPNDKDVNP